MTGKLLRRIATLGSALLAAALLSAPATAAPKPIRIGMPASMGVFYGRDCRDAQQLAINEINAAGGVKVGNEKRPFELVIEDTRDMEPGVPVTDALLGVERLITSKKVDFLIGGPVRSEAAFAARQMVNQYKKVWLVTIGTYSPGFGDAKLYPYGFRLVGNAGWQIKNVHLGMLKHLREKQGLKKIYVIAQDVKHARAAGDAVADLAAKEGFEILGKKTYPTGSSDFSMGLLEAKEKGAQILFLWIDMPELVNLAKQYSEIGLKALPIGYLGPAEHMTWWASTGGKGQYFTVDYLTGGNPPSQITPWTMKFVKAYEKAYGHEPDAYGIPSSYMGVYLLKDAIERAGTLDSDAVRDALQKTDMAGVYGRMRFDANNEIIFDPGFDPTKGAVTTFVQWQNGKRVVVFPESIKTGEILLPK